ncbi:ATP synthase, subunit d [Acyrthosiphon pisum]|uniref:ATP synthase subunit d, mitochondrial n=1 Tax=Acyrthosiphon pisum TaxID=7029 RepID=Q1ZZQ6_ACYPI|nr:ATP synthase, subunit d [Acyrthosiphon pisum]ABD76367.1 ATP synthase D-like protein [Acyrthosiphon pisum]|eukprot:NP_001119624.1 ATP synthase, subunit d [Acyrthosiphon pisum]
MASKRIAQSSVNWAAIAERVPEADKASYLAFKAKSDGYLRKMLAAPAEPLKIDWAAYKNKIAVPGLVDNFEKSYNAIKIPYPEDKYTPAIDKHEKEIIKGIEEFKAESEVIIKAAEKRIAEINSLLPFGQMTFEDAAYIQPELTLDLENKPSFWPHQEIDYINDEPEAENPQIEEQKKIDAAH